MLPSDVDRCMTEPSRSGYLEQCLYCIYNVLNCKSEFLEQLCCRAACAKGLHCHISAVEADILAPAEVGKCLNDNSLSDLFRKYGLFILRTLLLKDIHTRHGYDTDLLSFVCKLCFCLDRKINLRTACDEDRIRCSFAVVDDIAAL